MTKKAIVYVDGDACPVREEAMKVAERHGHVVTIVSNGGLRPSRDPMVRHVIVSDKADAADDWIVENGVCGDVVVTADILLAGRCVERGLEVISPTGKLFTQDNVGMAVAMRNLNQELRESGAIRGNNAPFSPKQRSSFLQQLDRILSAKKQ